MNINNLKLLGKSIKINYNRNPPVFSKDAMRIHNVLVRQYDCKYSKEIKLLLSYSFRILSLQSDTLLYSRDKNKFVGSVISYTKFIKLLNMLEQDGYVKLEIGYGYFDTVINALTDYKPSFIILTNKFQGMIKGVNRGDIIKPVKSDLINIRDGTRSVNKETKRKLEEELMNYNNFLADKQISVLLGDERIDVANIAYKRSYVGDLEHGGRYYDVTGFMSILPVSVRKTIHIDGESVCELDYKQLHPSMLYENKGIKLPKDFDMYEIYEEKIPEVFDLNWDKIEAYRKATGNKDYDPIRNIIKRCLLVMLNADDQRTCTYAMYARFNKEKNKLWDQWEKTGEGKLEFYGIDSLNSVVVIFDELERKHEQISEYFYKGIGLRLQNIDSTIASYVIEYFNRNDEVVLSMHDSFIVKSKLEKKLQSVMKEAYNIILKGDRNCRIKKEY